MSTIDEDPPQEHVIIHAERSWIVGVSIGLFIQFLGGIYWAGTLSAALASLETRVAHVEGDINGSNKNEIVKAEKVARIDERTTDILSSIGDIKAHIAAIETSLKEKYRR